MRADSIRRIRTVAEALASVRHELVFIGGTVLPLLVDVDLRFHAPRITKDVDAVAAAANYSKSQKIEESIRAANYRHHMSARHKGRWLGPNGEILDLSFAGQFMGASGSRVDELAIETAQEMDGYPDTRHLSPTGFFLMKGAAHADRGHENPFESRDLADLAVLVVGAPLMIDFADRSEEVKGEVTKRAGTLLADDRLYGAVVGHFGDLYPVPPDTAEELADETMRVLRLLAQ